MKCLRFLTLGVAALSVAVCLVAAHAGLAAADPPGAFTISPGPAGTLNSYTITENDGVQFLVGASGYINALLNITHTRAYKFEFLGCGTSVFDNRFYVDYAGRKDKIFDCDSSTPGDTFIAKMKVKEVGPHMPFHFQSDAAYFGPSVFNGEGPLDGVYSGNEYCNASIFYTIDRKDLTTASPLSGDAVIISFADGGVCPKEDADYQDMVIRISLPGH